VLYRNCVAIISCDWAAGVYDAPAPYIRALMPANMHVPIAEREALPLHRRCSVIASLLRHANNCSA